MSVINETAIKTPGVYLNEIPSFPPAVAQVATAIPAFVGYTEKAVDPDGNSVINIPYKIESLTEFIDVFGRDYTPAAGDAAITLDADNNSALVTKFTRRFLLFDSIRQFYDNGGSRCYVVSVGLYGSTTAVAPGDEGNAATSPGLRVGLKALEKYDEPTLILFPDAVMLTEAQLYALQVMSIEQCSKLQDRFSVLDLPEGSTTNWDTAVQNFRDGIGINSLDYGAAYTPWLYTTYDKTIDYSVIKDQVKKPVSAGGTAIDLKTLAVDSKYNEMVINLEIYLADVATIKTSVNTLKTANFKSLMDRYVKLRSDVSTAALAQIESKVSDLITFIEAIVAELPSWRTRLKNSKLVADLDNAAKDTAPTNLGSYIKTMVSIRKADSVRNDFFTGTAFNSVPYDEYKTATGWITPTVATIAKRANYTGADKKVRAIAMLPELNDIMNGISNFISKMDKAASIYFSSLQDAVYNNHPVISKIVSALTKELSLIPPSGTMVGIYSKTDATRGVWKAPANVSVNSVVKPSVVIDDLMQEDLNVNADGGKSNNAIRSFTGRGIKFWGARYHNGNSNEWRYEIVRRFFIMVEESCKKASAPFVFEPNDANTWVKVRAMIENYLTVLWRQGALAGAKPEHAFFVKVGLNSTMTADDILNGKLIVEVGLAAVRPAEFIILRFMHKMQES